MSNGVDLKYNLVAPTLQDGQTTDLQADVSGNLNVRVASNTGVFFPGTNSILKSEDAPAVSGDAGVFVLAVRNDTSATLTSTDGDYSAIAVDSTGKIGLSSSGALFPSSSALVKAEDVASASGDAGVFVLAVRRDNPVASQNANGDYGEFAIDQYGGQFQGRAINNSRLVAAAATTNATLAKNAAGRVFGINGVNKAAAIRYIKLYNKASAPTVGTDTPIVVFEVAASAAFNFNLDGMVFSTGISWALTAGTGLDADTNALAAGDITSMNILYS